MLLPQRRGRSRKTEGRRVREYISREAALQSLCRECNCKEYCDQTGETCLVYEWLSNIPAADVAPVVRGEWKINADGYYPYCSVCKQEPPGRCMTAHCPSCGARMDGGETNADD